MFIMVTKNGFLDQCDLLIKTVRVHTRICDEHRQDIIWQCISLILSEIPKHLPTFNYFII